MGQAGGGLPSMGERPLYNWDELNSPSAKATSDAVAIYQYPTKAEAARADTAGSLKAESATTAGTKTEIKSPNNALIHWWLTW